jgi:hypothetical protein
MKFSKNLIIGGFLALTLSACDGGPSKGDVEELFRQQSSMMSSLTGVKMNVTVNEITKDPGGDSWTASITMEASGAAMGQRVNSSQNITMRIRKGPDGKFVPSLF